MKKAWFVLIFLAGCQQNEFADLQTFMQQAGQGVQPALDPLPPIKPAMDYVYQPEALPDPFKPRKLKASTSGGGHQPDPNRKRLLAEFPLSALTMVGTLGVKDQKFALIKEPAPNYKIHRVSTGVYVGQNYGLVTKITDTGMELTELIQDGTGDWVESKATMSRQVQE